MFSCKAIFQGIPKLRNLNLKSNSIMQMNLPTNPNIVSNLVELNIGYNEITHLPIELLNFKSLKSLRLENNFIAEIPSFFEGLNLKTLKVASNPLTDPPLEVIERGRNAMKRYWCNQQMNKVVKTGSSDLSCG
jgi:Leucine-rich repeat (LRR) protein